MLKKCFNVKFNGYILFPMFREQSYKELQEPEHKMNNFIVKGTGSEVNGNLQKTTGMR